MTDDSALPARIAELEREVALLRADRSSSLTPSESVARQWRTFDAVLSYTADCISVWDTDARLLYANRAALNYWHRSSDDVAGRTLFDFDAPPVAAQIDRQIREAIQLGRPVRHQGLFTGPGGETREWEYILTPILDSLGTVEFVTCAARARDEAGTILESTADGFFVLDKDWCFSYVNPAAERLLGFSRIDLLGKNHWELYPAAIGTLSEREYRRAVRDRVTVEFDYLYEPWQRWFAVKAAPTREAGLSVHLHEITEIKKAEQELRRQWHMFDTALSHTPDFTYTFDLEGRFTYVNRALLSLWQMPLEKAIGKNFFELQYPADLATRLQDQIQQVIDTGHVIRDQTPFTGPTGETRHYEYIFVPVLASGGQVEAVAGSTRDVTERKQAEEQERAREVQLRDSARLESLGVMAGGIAHDFNNLLVGILGNASLLVEMIQGTERDMANDIVLAAERAADLTRQMLAFSGKGRFLLELLDLNAIVQENLTLLRASLSRAITVELELESNACLIEADRGQIQQVVMNLLINASEAIGDRPGKVAIRTAFSRQHEAHFSAQIRSLVVPGDYVLLEIRDDGSGMAPEIKSRIFDPFFTTKFTGRGLGLAAVLGIVKGHHGDIRVESQPGAGTVFSVLLPACGRVNPSIVQPGSVPAGVRTGQLVLVVDDEEIVQRTAAATLESRGFRVLSASNGHEAIESLRVNPDVSLVLLDLTMPVMNGEQTIPKIKALSPNIPIILSSGYNQAEISSRFASAGLAGFLQKPYTTAALISQVVRVLEISKGI